MPAPPLKRVLEVSLYADDLDAKVNAAGRLVSSVEEGEWTAYDRSLERAFFRPPSAAVAPSSRPLPPPAVVRRGGR